MNASANAPGSGDKDLKTEAKAAGDKAAEHASDTAARLREKAAEAASAARAEAEEHVDEARGQAASEVDKIADALRKAAHDLHDGSPQARVIGQVAEGLADAAETFRSKDLAEVGHDITDLARRNPMMFLGGAALLGFAVTRFVRASSRRGTTDSFGRSMDRGRDYARSGPQMYRGDTTAPRDYSRSGASGSGSMPGSAAGSTGSAQGTAPGSTGASGTGAGSPGATKTAGTSGMGSSTGSTGPATGPGTGDRT